MTSRVVGRQTLAYDCDAPGCRVRMTDQEFVNGGGMQAMGWSRHFDDKARRFRHYCPAHTEE